MSEHTYEGPAVKRLERSRSDRMLAGVSGGLARYFDIAPAFYRVGFVVLTLLGGAGILVYFVAALVIPAEGEEDSIAAAALRNRRERPWPLLGLALVTVAAAVLIAHGAFWPSGDAAWVLLLLAGAAILWITRRVERRAPTAPAASAPAPAALAREDSRRVGRVFRWLAISFAILVVLLLIAAASLAAAFHVDLGNGVGDRRYTVTTKTQLQRDYKLGIGNLRIDLTGMQFPAGKTRLTTRVDVGELRVLVPEGVALQVHAHTQAGNVELLGQKLDGTSVDRRIHQKGARVLVLDAHVGAGNLQVLRAVR
jgi:phage shock protein PspC (stress-responsive transcriptional regulator)